MFHVYLNKFEIAVTHLSLIIFCNNWYDLWKNAVAKKIALNFIRWFETVSEDKLSNCKRLKMLSETKCS